MSNSIVENKRRILRVSNGSLGMLYDKLVDILNEKSIKDEFTINFIDKMDQCTYGRGGVYLDINEFYKKPESLIGFISLIKEANTEIVKSGAFKKGWPEAMQIFIEELNSYYEKIKIK